jgi:hypothetical protein
MILNDTEMGCSIISSELPRIRDKCYRFARADSMDSFQSTVATGADSKYSPPHEYFDRIPIKYRQADDSMRRCGAFLRRHAPFMRRLPAVCAPFVRPAAHCAQAACTGQSHQPVLWMLSEI